MEMQLSNLIEKIKQEGIKEAEEKSQALIKQAEKEKEAIIKKAQDKAAALIKQAEQDAVRLRENARQAVSQAVRDSTLSLKEAVKGLFESALKKEIHRALEPDFVAGLILRLAESWSGEKEAVLEFSLSPEDKEKLQVLVFSRLKKDAAGGLSFKANPHIDKGLYIGIKGKDFHYDFSDEAILEVLKQYLRPFIAGIIE